LPLMYLLRLMLLSAVDPEHRAKTKSLQSQTGCKNFPFFRPRLSGLATQETGNY
jgi:hypothetical protein